MILWVWLCFQVARMVLWFVLVFALCFLPSHVFYLWFYFDPDSQHNYNHFWHFLRILGFCTSFTNSCLNPLTLYALSGTFRKVSTPTSPSPCLTLIIMYLSL